MLQLDDHWVWDFWLARDISPGISRGGSEHHLFYLYAPKSLGSEHRRHRNARIGHATSPDLVNWTVLPEALGPRGAGYFDETATWTGCVVRSGDEWVMFYTGSRFLHAEPEHANIETIGRAVSADLNTWVPDREPVLVADSRWYETLGDSSWPEEAWRDPWVYPVEDGWEMLITARARPGAGFGDSEAGVIGRAFSADLVAWEARPPLSAPGAGFVHLEVPQLVTVLGREFLIFSCPASGLSGARLGSPGGIWSVPVRGGVLEPEDASLLLEEHWYSGRVVEHEGSAKLLAFANTAADGTFPGVIGDPFDLGIGVDGRLRVMV
ncbi:glycoside hydrolase family protein [Kineosporia succinea]|uniref:Beta-fructofuranosidase n=1 Tax=Kineosporia succinea TaxID=84632 RepID=A0ABT9PDC8_9ACTN|nr:hypothetical protein [Kineosporia succinea]MDP9830728.1 beta-fructofuranosidase [Kineosporia succinea]